MLFFVGGSEGFLVVIFLYLVCTVVIMALRDC